MSCRYGNKTKDERINSAVGAQRSKFRRREKFKIFEAFDGIPIDLMFSLKEISLGVLT